jgi:hypothetical protein
MIDGHVTDAQAERVAVGILPQPQRVGRREVILFGVLLRLDLLSERSQRDALLHRIFSKLC